MNEKFTKGPWEWVWLWADDGAKYIDIENSNFEEIIGQNGLYSEDDASLITAAPDLYEALKAALKYIEESPCDPDIYPEQFEAWDKLQELKPKDVLAKARGEL